MKHLYKVIFFFLLTACAFNLTAQTPTLVKDLKAGFSNSFPSKMIVFNGKLYFSASGDNGTGLYVYDGVNDPSLVVDNTVGGSPQDLVVFNNKLYFTLYAGSTGREIYVYDGTNIPTMLGDLTPGSGGGALTLTVIGDKLYFNQDGHLWKYDGTNTPVKVTSGTFSIYSNFVEYNNKIYFGAASGTDSKELWVYDKVNAPTRVTDIITGNPSNTLTELAVFNNKLYFAATDGVKGNELWVYDGSNASLVYDIYNGSNNSDPMNFVVYKSKLYFSARESGATGKELYVYDGANNPSLVANLSFSGDGDPNYFLILNDVLYFGAAGSGVGDEVWSYTGTGTPAVIADLWSSDYPGWARSSMVIYNGKLYFCGNDGSSGFELFVFEPSTSVGVAKSSFGSNLSLFPNPTNGKVAIDLGKSYNDVTVEVVSTKGEVVFSTAYTDAQRIDFTFDAIPGLYHVRVSSGDGASTSLKITKE